MATLEEEVIGGSKASGVIQAIMANKEDYLSKLTPEQLDIVGEHFGVDKKVRKKDGRNRYGENKRKYVRKHHSALQIREQVLQERGLHLTDINDFIKERFPDVRPNRPYKLREDLKTDFRDGRNQLASKSVLKKGAEEGKDEYEDNLREYKRLPAFFKNIKGRDPNREKDPYTMINTNDTENLSLEDALPYIYKKCVKILKYLLGKGISITDYDGLTRLPDAYSKHIYNDLDTINKLLSWWGDEFAIPETYEDFKEENEEDPDEGFAGLYNENKDFARAMDFAFALKKLYGLKEDDTFASVGDKYPPPKPDISGEDYLKWVERSGIENKYYETEYIEGAEQRRWDITNNGYYRTERRRRLVRKNGKLVFERDAYPFAPYEAKRKGIPLVFGKKIREPLGGFRRGEKEELQRRVRRINRILKQRQRRRDRAMRGNGMVIFPDSYRMRGGGAPPERAFFKGATYAYDKVAPNVLGDGYVKIVDTPTFDAYLRRSDKSILLASRGTNITSWGDLKADAQLVANRLRKTNRYAKDVSVLRQIIAKYPPEDGYEYYIAGHSLSVAIATQLKRDFPFIKNAVGYNGAFQPADLAQQAPDIKRLYTDKDFLYNLGGKMFRNVKVIPMTETKAKGFFGRIASTFTPSGIKGHSLSNFKSLYGLGMKSKGAELVRRVKEKRGGCACDLEGQGVGSSRPTIQEDVERASVSLIRDERIRNDLMGIAEATGKIPPHSHPEDYDIPASAIDELNAMTYEEYKEEADTEDYVKALNKMIPDWDTLKAKKAQKKAQKKKGKKGKGATGGSGRPRVYGRIDRALDESRASAEREKERERTRRLTSDPREMIREVGRFQYDADKMRGYKRSAFQTLKDQTIRHHLLRIPKEERTRAERNRLVALNRRIGKKDDDEEDEDSLENDVIGFFGGSLKGSGTPSYEASNASFKAGKKHFLITAKKQAIDVLLDANLRSLYGMRERMEEEEAKASPNQALINAYDDAIDKAFEERKKLEKAQYSYDREDKKLKTEQRYNREEFRAGFASGRSEWNEKTNAQKIKSAKFGIPAQIS